MQNCWEIGLLIIMLLGSSLGLWGQTDFPGRGGFTPREDIETRGQDEFIDEPDTFGIFSFFSANPNLENPFSDSLLDNYFHQYDPVRKRDVEWMNLGIVGSATRYILYQPRLRRGFEIGLNQYNIYHTNASDLPYYRLEKPFTDLSYTQGAEQNDAYFTAKFSRNFANGLNFTLDYERISQFGDGSQFPNQNNRNTALTMGMWYNGAGGKYDAFFAYAANTIEQEDNGGLETEPLRDGEFQSLSSANVFLDDGQTRNTHREWSYSHYYKFGGQRDSIKGIRRAYTLFHELNYKRNTYKFADDFSDSDATFFNRFPGLLVDSRGIRHFIRHNKLENSFRISTFKADSRGDNEARNQKDLLELGITHTYHTVDRELADTVINNLFLTGKWRLNPGPGLLLETSGHFGLWANAGDYRVGGTLAIDFKRLGKLTLAAVNQLYKPNLIEHSLILSQREVWSNNFDRTLETSLGATYALPSLDLELSGYYHLLNNYVYYDSTAFARQTGVPISILQLVIKKNFRFWKIHLDNVVTLQQVSEDFIRVPEIYSKHSLYFEGNWFKVLHVRWGVDLRFNNSYFSEYYNPVIGQFQLQNERETTFYPAVDAFLSMHVTKFRAFFKIENLTSIWIKDRLFYQTAFYAHPPSAFRMGIRWRFSN